MYKKEFVVTGRLRKRRGLVNGARAPSTADAGSVGRPEACARHVADAMSRPPAAGRSAGDRPADAMA